MPSFYSRPPHERFRPVAVRARVDGWTVERQRGFVRSLGEGLAVDQAARAVGMTGRSAHRLRARAGARSFAKAWDTAAALAAPAPDIRRPWRWRLHRWRGRIVRRERVWDEAAVARLLARHDPYAAGADDLSYTDGAGRAYRVEHFRTFEELTRALDQATRALRPHDADGRPLTRSAWARPAPPRPRTATLRTCHGRRSTPPAASGRPSAKPGWTPAAGAAAPRPP